MKDNELDELLVPLFVQARQEALKEGDNLVNGGVVTSTPTKVRHLVKEAEQAIQLYTQRQVIAELKQLKAAIDQVNKILDELIGDK